MCPSPPSLSDVKLDTHDFFKRLQAVFWISQVEIKLKMTQCNFYWSDIVEEWSHLSKKSNFLWLNAKTFTPQTLSKPEKIKRKLCRGKTVFFFDATEFRQKTSQTSCPKENLRKAPPPEETTDDQVPIEERHVRGVRRWAHSRSIRPQRRSRGHQPTDPKTTESIHWGLTGGM